MTFQPPPPPPPASGPAAFDPKSVNPLDWGIIAAGVLAFLFSFFDWYSFSAGGITLSENGWNGFFGWFAVLLCLVGAALVAMLFFAPQVKLPVPNRLAGLGAFGLATVFMILAIFVTPSYNGIDVPDSVDTGRDFGFWLSLIVVIAGMALSLMRFQASGGQLPGGLQGRVPDIGGYGPQDRPGPGAGPSAPGPGAGPRPGDGTPPPPPPPPPSSGYPPPQ